MKIQPIQDRIICIKPSGEQVTTAGIVIPGIVDDAEEAEVVAVGPGKYGNDGLLIPMSVKVGDRIIFNKHQVQPIRLPDDPQEYIALRDEDVRGVVC